MSKQCPVLVQMMLEFKKKTFPVKILTWGLSFVSVLIQALWLLPRISTNGGKNTTFHLASEQNGFSSKRNMVK